MRRFRGLCIRGGRGTRKSRGSESGQELKHNQQAMADGQGCSNNSAIEQNKGLAEGSGTKNIILNHDFSKGLQFWHPNSCNANTVLDAGGHYVVVTNRKESWQGLEQDISGQVVPHLNYNLSSLVRIGGDVQGTASVQATLRLDFEGSSTEYQLVSRVTASIDRWAKLTGSFSLSRMPKRVIFYFEGPPPGVDLQIASVAVFHSPTSTHEEAPISSDGNENIMQNSNFEDGLNNWSGRGCKIVIQESIDGKVLPLTGKVFASAINRSQSWNGIQQEITSRVQRKTAYNVFAVVRLHGTATAAIVRATLWVQNPNGREQYIGISSLQASDTEWSQLQGKFLLNGSPSRVVIYLEGPPPGTDILLNSMVVKHAERATPLPPPDFENVLFGENIVANSNLNDSLSSWFPLGSCTLSIADGSPHVIPPMARESLGLHEPLNGRYILVSNRTQTWMGPAQTITDRLKLHVTYQVSAWVRVGPGGTGRQNVNIALGVDSQWVNGGQVDIVDNTWHEIGGSFRIEKQPSKVIVYLQGPSAGIDLMVAGLHIFPVDRKARFKYLRRQTDKVRKRDIVIKFSGSDTGTLSAAFVKIRQFENSFPIGSCVNRTNIDNEDFVQFFVKNFNWGVFGNELKWYWTESQQGTLNYTDADELLDFCSRNGIKARGHCIFWEVDGTVQSWVKSLSKDDLKAAVQNRLTSLLSRYNGKFEHYDVDNEMLHGSFYQDRLGNDIRAYMFKTTHQFDPSATLFVNDYHVEDGTDPKASPEMYIQQILDLQGQGAQVGGIGIQGHIDYPVGPMVCSALDKLATLGLPIWFTELDVSAANEYIRADDLEVMLREAFAHPAVEGIMLWGFWELYMSRDDAFLVDAEGGVNEAGKRYLELKKEWLTHAHGQIDDNGEFRFRGFQGTYHAEIVTMDKKISQDFVVIGGDSPFEGLRGNISSQHRPANIIANYDFSRGLHSWHPNCCNGHVVTEQDVFSDGIGVNLGVRYAIMSGRTQSWQGLEQDITAKVSPGTLYLVSAWVRVWRFHEQLSEIKATLKLEHTDSPTSYLSVGRIMATASKWTELRGSFSLTAMPKRILFFLEGPPPGVDLLTHSVTISLSSTERHQSSLFGTNIIKNSDPRKGLGAWYPLGSCTLTIYTGGPHLLPPTARDSLGKQIPVSGHYIMTTNRTENWMGPAQDITERLKLHLTYQVSAWVRVGSGASASQIVNVALGVDGNWLNGGQTEVHGDRWYELTGSFRIEKRPSKVVAYVQGPLPGVDLMVAELSIFPVARKDRFIQLKEQTEKVRKRDVLLKFTGKHANNLVGVTVNVNQIANNFPFGSCINRSNLDNEDFVEFFLKNFNWAVFGNELKWYHTEPEQGKLKYSDADEMLNFCEKHGIKTRGHCIFWEVTDAIQPWVQSLSITDLMTAVQNRLRGLLLRYKGQFQHYDVNNEMLHGTFYQDRLGRDIRAYMFKAARELDPSAKLFVNDYHIEDGCDAKSCPERYIQQILDLQECGAPVDGIGIQGHIRNPVGPIICSALDKLAILGLPIWFTELDVLAENEHVRADDLEVVLREAFAHPAVEGIMLWGFWEMFMCDDHCHLVNAEGDINEAGKRFLELKREWMTNADGEINADGEFRFRGFNGTYKVEIRTPGKVYSKMLVVEKGDLLQVVEIEM